tara:strand:+ start:389 stop:847 length:459 start_codon:yes stop_codon:yes gene_type:complete
VIKKLNKISILLLLVLTNCGYSPIFSINNSNFKILNINLEGEKKINYIIENKLNYYKNIKADRSYKVKINSKKKTTTLSKDAKGNPNKFNLEIIVVLKLDYQDNKKIEKIFIKNISYNNLSNKFDLSNYEKNIQENLTQKISEDIIIYMQSL